MSTEDTMRTLRLNVPGITCEGWVISIRMAVGQLKGTGKVSGDAKSRTLSVRYEPSEVTVESMQEALSQIGYESTVLPL